MMKSRWIGVISVVAAGTLTCGGSPGRAAAGPGSASASVQIALTPNRARYLPGEPVQLAAKVVNHGPAPITGVMQITAMHLNQRVAQLPAKTVTVPAHRAVTLAFGWKPPTRDDQGYFLEGTFETDRGARRRTFATAVDVSSTWSKFPRYGFVSEYPKRSKAQVQQELEQLNAYHIDALQFYDWQWKHDVPVAGTVAYPAASWQDIAGRTNYRRTILEMIAMGHHLGMESFNYNLLYGAWADYRADGVNPKWGLYSDPNGQSQVNDAMPSGWNTSAIDVFNPGNPAWRHYILGQEAKVFKLYPFDGWQVDQLGYLGLVDTAEGQPVNLTATFAPFLNAAVKTLHKQVIFNNVGAYGLTHVASASRESVVYVEAWPASGQVAYSDLQGVINEANTLTGHTKGVVLAAYLDSAKAQNYSDQHPGYFGIPGVLLADAAIFASGGDHIELGDNLQMLNGPYFPNHNLIMSASLKADLLSYYDFMTAYENLLRGPFHRAMLPVSITHVNTSADGAPQTVWAFSKTSRRFDVLQLINLDNQPVALWQDSTGSDPAPMVLHHRTVRYDMGAAHPTAVYLASPDYAHGATQSLKFQVGHDKQGTYVTFDLPALKYWDMVYVAKS